MTTDHNNTCRNNCTYAKKAVFLSRAGTSEDWLYRCTKLEERVITTDSVLHKLGCATYTTGKSEDTQDDLVKRAQEMLNEINIKIGEDNKKEMPVPPTVPAPEPEPVKPVERTPEPVVVPVQPVAILPTGPVFQHTSPFQANITEELVKKKRGRKPKQVPTAEPQVVAAPELPKEPINKVEEEVIKDGGITEGNKL